MALDGRIWNKFDNWERVAQSDDLEHVRQRITGLKPGWWNPNAEIAGLDDAIATIKQAIHADAGHNGHVVDFGSGLGRNVGFLRSHFSRVIAHDLPDMIAKLGGVEEAASYDAMYGDLDALVGAEDADIVYDSVVFQHISDRKYSEAVVAKLLTMKRFRYFISLCNITIRPEPGMEGWAPAALALRAAGWTEEFVATDSKTFSRPHVLRILRRPG